MNKNESFFVEVRDAIERYNTGMRPMTWISIFAFALHPGLFGINYGRSGDGKSRSTTELAEALRLYRPEEVDENGKQVSPVVVAPNSCTDRVFFDFLMGHRNKCIIIDDASRLSKQQVSLLKEAMGETGEVEYTTSRDAERNRFVFTGAIIMNTNYEEQEQAINTRAYMNYYYFDHEDLLKRRKQARDYELNDQWEKDKATFNKLKKEIEKVIKRNVSGKELPKLTTEEKKRVFEAVDSIDVDFFSNASMRDDAKAKKIAQLFKNMFGSLDGEIWDEAQSVIVHYITAGIIDPASCVVQIVEQYMRKYDTKTVYIYELIEILKKKYPNHNFKSWLDTAFAKQRIKRGINKLYVVLPDMDPEIRV